MSEAIKVGDTVREVGKPKAPTYKVVAIKDGELHLSGPGPCRGMAYCDPEDVEVVRPTPSSAGGAL